MEKIERLKEIIETYERFQPRFRELGIQLGETEGGGFWIPTRFEHLIPFLEYAFKKRLMEAGHAIVDAGSGTGVPSAVFDVYGFKPVINIERDKRYVDASLEVLEDLARRSVIGDDIRTIHGDFTEMATYEKAGMSFQNIPYFYMGINSEPLNRLAALIRNNSRRGTKLIVYGMMDEGKEPKLGLRLEDRFRTRDQIADFLVYKK